MEYNTLGTGNRWRIWESSNLGNLLCSDFGILGNGGCDQGRSRERVQHMVTQAKVGGVIHLEAGNCG